MKKFIEFETVGDLEKKVKALKEITVANKQDIKSYLIIHNIPFQEFEDGSFGVDLQACPPSALNDYMEEFGQLNEVTMQKFRALGVVYIDAMGSINFRLDLETRKN